MTELPPMRFVMDAKKRGMPVAMLTTAGLRPWAAGDGQRTARPVIDDDTPTLEISSGRVERGFNVG